METLVLTKDYIAARVSPKAYLAAVTTAFEALAVGRLSVPAVGHVSAEQGGAFHIKAAASRGTHARAVIKVNGNFPGNVAHALPTIQGFIALLDASRGSVLALMDSTEITARRTAAASALAASRLAAPGSVRLGIVGCGVQARYHFEALQDLFAISHLACHDVDEARAVALARIAQASGVEAQVLSSPRAAARDAQILVTCTTSTRAFLGADDVPAGCFVAAVGADNPGKQELEPALLRRARVVPDILAQASTMGDLHHALDAGVMKITDIHGELADVVTGRVAGRRDDGEMFIFDSTGTAIEDLAAAELAYEIACADANVLRVALGR
jgi:ornithine cyclodeaminase/alanine dehydrogenase-like protein (mu-crystallin family)